jgi:hypothetical protein
VQNGKIGRWIRPVLGGYRFFAKAEEVLANVETYQLSLIENAGRLYRRC